MLARVISQNLNVRSTPRIADGNIIGNLTRGQIVEVKGLAPGAPRWAMTTYEGQDAFVARRLLAQSPDQPILRLDSAVESLLTDVILAATRNYDGITYRLGCKAKADGTDRLIFSGTDIDHSPCSGSTVDCSGWISGLFQLIAANINASLARPIFDGNAAGLFSTHSDGQVVNVGEATGQVYSGIDIDQMELRSGLIFGLNNGDHDWEGNDRVFEIDHIVMGVKDQRGYAVTQSSSSGGGVNKVSWQSWRQANDSRFRDFRAHCVDPLAMGAWQRDRRSPQSSPMSVEEPVPMSISVDPLSAPAG